tara:strand:- start:1060 stop:2103 length:1044 start_codon:yes stop_codon:yes gene_type:complete
MNNNAFLTTLGWLPFFQQQLSEQEWESAVPARIVEQHKASIEVENAAGRLTIALHPGMPLLTVGDWLLLDANGAFLRALERRSCFRRKAAGSRLTEQLIAANIDTAFIVCSMNEDFNLNRIERYLSIVNEAGSTPVLVLSKMDLCPDPDHYLDQLRQLDNQLCTELVNCLDSHCVSVLLPWCQLGKTVVMLGSSGSGKSSLSNTLLGAESQKTAAIREDDAKGRHTTTRRSLLKLPGGAMILDTPGMRELQLVDCEEGIATTFSDIDELSSACRFSDCQHDNEPGCRVQAAINSGELELRRFKNYSKLLREQALNKASLAERRASDKKFGSFYKKVINESVKAKRGE